MIVAPSGIKVHIACGVTDMRKGIDGLATLVQEVLLHDPFAGHLFAFRGGKANLIKILYWDGTGLCLFTNRLEHRIFEWPTVGGAGETVSLTDVSGLDVTKLCYGSGKSTLRNRSSSFSNSEQAVSPTFVPGSFRTGRTRPRWARGASRVLVAPE